MLHVDLRAVDQIALECLTQDWVQGLIEDVTWLDETQRCDHHVLHALNWIFCLGSNIHIKWTMSVHCRDQVKKRMV